LGFLKFLNSCFWRCVVLPCLTLSGISLRSGVYLNTSKMSSSTCCLPLAAGSRDPAEPVRGKSHALRERDVTTIHVSALPCRGNGDALLSSFCKNAGWGFDHSE
jgi:hypothetical protein